MDASTASRWRALLARHKVETWCLVALLCVHVLLGIYWSVTIPIWEAHDEDGHYYFVRYLATEHSLPPRGWKSPSRNDESHQPPLYYILAAVPVSLVNVDDDASPKLNPYVFWTYAQGGVNRVVHDPVAEAWPYRGTYLAIHLARWVSVLVGALGLLFTFWAARLLAPEQPWVRWGATLALAFWPQYRFSTAVINNDIMVTAAAAAVMWLLVRVIVVRPLRAYDLLGLGAATGVALLSKGVALALLPVVMIVVVGCVVAAGRRAWRLLMWLLGAAVLAAALVGWWYARNVSEGVGVLGATRDLKFLRLVVNSLFLFGGLGKILYITQRGFFSLWATFGWATFYLPGPTYWAAGGWGVLGVLGLVPWLVRRPPRRVVLAALGLALAAAAIIAGAVALWIEEQQTDLTGRYLLPTLPALCVLISVGWSAILPRRLHTAGWALMAGALAVFVALIPGIYIGPAYAAPALLNDAEAAAYTPVHVTFGDFVELAGYQLEDRFVDPGGMLRLRLLWRVRARTDVDLTLAVQAFEGERHLVGEAHRFPGHGAFATTTWQPGALFSEEVAIPISSSQPDGHLAWVEVSYYNANDLSPVEVKDQAGHSRGMSMPLGPLKIRGTAPPVSSSVPEGLRFGPTIRLVDGRARVGDQGGASQLDLDLTWAATGRQDTDYTVSIQLRDATETIVSQVDRQPRDGAYPTSLWEAGELVDDEYLLPLPADLPVGHYTLYACVYELATGQRLPIIDTGGQPLARDEVPLGTVLAEAGRPAVFQSSCPLIK